MSTEKESYAQQRIRALSPRYGVWLWRNNSGCFRDSRGVPVRFGLGNDSRRANAQFKSSDLIGVAPGGLFCSVEVKPEGWTYRGGEHEAAQLAWIELIRDLGGMACFATSWDDVEAYLRERRNSHP